MKILITGASGFLGRALISKLGNLGHELVGLNSKNCDLTKQDSLDLFNDRSYDQIYHLSAWTKAGDFCLYHSGEQWIINQKINTNVLAWWLKYQPQAKLICMGTSCGYDPNMELIEENYLLGKPIDSLYTYAMTKRMLYVGLVSLNKQFGLKYLYLIPSTLYGPGYRADAKNSHFIFDLLRKIMRGKLYGEKVVLWGDGNQRREFRQIGRPGRKCLAQSGFKTSVPLRPFKRLHGEHSAEDPCECEHAKHESGNVVPSHPAGIREVRRNARPPERPREFRMPYTENDSEKGQHASQRGRPDNQVPPEFAIRPQRRKIQEVRNGGNPRQKAASASRYLDDFAGPGRNVQVGS